ncbi:hypothetical protein AVEN_53636-1 [Araneus ventricosus]|uniref:DUF5641 domain-containing protein n=1 Tax=Araneus ventricosus TaxID=182803 RepID=A0A4Y2RLH9_ARAVE|nr:hypothetical protein AVEN_53636-1 [Araneus ventricosus]
MSAALLLACLVSKVISIIQVPINHIYMWSDSTIALAWIKTPHEKLKTYVSNRVKTINTLCPNFDCRHVNSAGNPADLISRGTSATNLVNNSLWFHGPTFIKSEISLPVDTIELNNNEFLNEVKTSCASVLICNSSNDFIIDSLNLSNSFTKLCRIVSYIFRFIHNSKNPTERKKGKLNASKIKEDSNFMVKKAQLYALSKEIKGLSNGLDIKQSKIKNLVPFLDEDNILRVGGRLQKTRLTQDEKHPKLLPAKHRLTKIIMEFFTKDPHDYTALTPGHFLIGRPITSIAEPQLIEKSDNYLSRWQKITKLLQQVWKNWKRDYLNNLRNKWQFDKNNVSPNDMVILKDSDLPPYKWRLGRIQEIIKGSDGYVKVVIVRVSNGIVKRGISQICLLPMQVYTSVIL